MAGDRIGTVAEKVFPVRAASVLLSFTCPMKNRPFE